MEKKKIITAICILPFMIFMLLWCGDLVSDSVLTHLHGDEFKLTQEQKEELWLYDIDYFKVLNYKDDKAELYYVCGDNTSAHVVAYNKNGGQWVPERTVNTIWAVNGSASETIWPYWWHFVYGGA